MDAQKVDQFLIANARFFESHQISAVREKLLALDDSRFVGLLSLDMKDPSTMMVVSLLSGALGIDRFLLGDTGLGVGKLLTCGGLGIWTIVDWFIIMGRAREVNFQKIMFNL